MALRDARAGATSAAFLQLTLITLACTVISVSAQLPIPWAPPQEESFINGQITTSPFAFQPGTALDGSHQCLTNTTLSPPLVVAAPCFTAGSNEYSNLADKWTWNFKDQTVHPWIGAQYRQPGAYCLDGGSLIIAPGSTYSSTFISIAPCVAQSPTQQWWWDGAYLQILPTIQKDRWFAASTTDSTHFQLTSNRSAATPLNFVLPPYSKESTYTIQPGTVHSEPNGVNLAFPSEIDDGPGPCPYAPHAAGTYYSSADCSAKCDVTPKCIGTNFGISGGIGCCYLKAYFPPATSSSSSGYSTYVKGTSAVPWFPALNLPSTPIAPGPAPGSSPNTADPSASKSSGTSAALVGGLVAAGVALVLIAAVVCCVWCGCRKRRAKLAAKDPEGSPDGKHFAPVSSWPGDGVQDKQAFLPWKEYRYEELLSATGHFSDGNLLGEGAFGRVYRAKLPNGTPVAVKQLKTGPRGATKSDFEAEVSALARVSHKNLVAFRGYCVTHDSYYLILDLASGGNLDFALRAPQIAGSGVEPLTWDERLRIAAAAAQGIKYLHEDCSPSFIHRDIKAANILLDSKQHAKVADFGLAKLMDEQGDASTTMVKGSWGYLAPEYALRGQVTKKSDVYSFGVVLLELLTGRRSQRTLPNGTSQLLTEQVVAAVRQGAPVPLDPLLPPESVPPEQAAHLLEIALACTDPQDYTRPDIGEVSRVLDDLSRGVIEPQSFSWSQQYSTSPSGLYRKKPSNGILRSEGSLPEGLVVPQAPVVGFGTPLGTPATSFATDQTESFAGTEPSVNMTINNSMSNRVLSGR